MKLGLMVPANNTTMEVELPAWLPEGTSCRTVRIPRGEGLLTRETMPAYAQKAIALSDQLAGDACELVVYGCTAAGFIGGPAADAELSDAIHRTTGKPVVTTANAMVLALQDCGAREIAVVTPYLDDVNARLGAYLGESGIRVRRLDSFRAPDTRALGRITAREVADLARATVTDDCDALFIACSQLPTYEVLDELERELKRPVWSSIKATAWRVRGVLAPAARDFFKKRRDS
jgi:maleate cis-trans isomerase